MTTHIKYLLRTDVPSREGMKIICDSMHEVELCVQEIRRYFGGTVKHVMDYISMTVIDTHINPYYKRMFGCISFEKSKENILRIKKIGEKSIRKPKSVRIEDAST